jgi:hypothetical protein
MEVVRADTQRARCPHHQIAKLNNSCRSACPNNGISGEVLGEVLVHLEHAHFVFATKDGPELLVS